MGCLFAGRIHSTMSKLIGCSKYWELLLFLGFRVFAKITTIKYFFSGLTFTVLQKFMDLADIQWFSKTLFYSYQHSLILPMVNEHFIKSLDEARAVVIAKGMSMFLCVLCPLC